MRCCCGWGGTTAQAACGAHPDPWFLLPPSPKTAQRKIREIVQQVKQQEQKHAQGAPASQHSK